jgi:hypothetical protein
MHERKLLRIYGEGNFDAEHTAIFFARIVEAYKSLLVLDKIMLAAEHKKIRRLKVNPVTPFIEAEEDRLRLVAVEFHSPGFWEFLGKLNPLEVLRQYLNDRHQREKDEKYRNAAEKRKLQLENERGSIDNSVLKLKFVREFIDTCRHAGVSEAEIQALVKEHALAPLIRLDAVAAQGLITYAESPEQEGAEEEVELV